jgi:hypothetical protein
MSCRILRVKAKKLTGFSAEAFQETGRAFRVFQALQIFAGIAIRLGFLKAFAEIEVLLLRGAFPKFPARSW